LKCFELLKKAELEKMKAAKEVRQAIMKIVTTLMNL